MQNREITILIIGVTILSAFIFAAVGIECTGHRQMAYMVLAMGWTINLLFTVFAWVSFRTVGMNQ